MAKERTLEGLNIPVAFGGFYTYLAPLSVFAILLPQLMKEKVEKLRIGLQLFGVSSASHWLSWSITGAVYSLTCGVCVPVIARLFGFEMFINSPLFLTVPYYTLAAFSLVTLAFLVSTIVNTEQAGYTV